MAPCPRHVHCAPCGLSKPHENTSDAFGLWHGPKLITADESDAWLSAEIVAVTTCFKPRGETKLESGNLLPHKRQEWLGECRGDKPCTRDFCSASACFKYVSSILKLYFTYGFHCCCFAFALLTINSRPGRCKLGVLCAAALQRVLMEPVRPNHTSSAAPQKPRLGAPPEGNPDPADSCPPTPLTTPFK